LFPSTWDVATAWQRFRRELREKKVLKRKGGGGGGGGHPEKLDSDVIGKSFICISDKCRNESRPRKNSWGEKRGKTGSRK